MAAAVADCAERPFTMSDVSSCAPAAQRQSGNSDAVCLQATHACERRHLRMAQLGELVNQWLEEVNAGHQTPVNGSIEATQDVSHAIYSGLQATRTALNFVLAALVDSLDRHLAARYGFLDFFRKFRGSIGLQGKVSHVAADMSMHVRVGHS